MAYANRGGFAPRQGRALSVGLLVSLAFLAMAALANPPLTVDMILGVALLIWVATTWATYRHSELPTSHAEHLDALLVSYEPLSQAAYRVLQTQVKDYGFFHAAVVEQWIESETYAIHEASGSRVSKAMQFLNKRV